MIRWRRKRKNVSTINILVGMAAGFIIELPVKLIIATYKRCWK